MTTGSKTQPVGSRYHQNAYQFVFDALKHTQDLMGKSEVTSLEELESSHITGPELLEGVRQLALERYGLLSKTVFEQWNVQSTADFGRIVFELIERGEMRKTDRDQLEDFFNVFDFETGLTQGYEIDTETAF